MINVPERNASKVTVSNTDTADVLNRTVCTESNERMCTGYSTGNDVEDYQGILPEGIE